MRKLLFTLFSTVLIAVHGHENKPPTLPDSHAPISIMGDHTHDAEEWMVSLRYMYMEMDGMRSGTDSVSTSDVFADGYTVSPLNMNMEMVMLGVMYAPTDRLTMMAKANYTMKSMDHRINPNAPAMLFNVVGGDTFTTESDGFGDVKIQGLFQFLDQKNTKAHIGMGLSLPTGSIDEKDNTPRPGMPPTFPNSLLPAAMQLGSGTFDLLPQMTFLRDLNKFSLGLQTNGVVRLESENSNGYRLGNELEVVGWGGTNLADWVSLEGGLSYRWIEELRGQQEGIGRSGPAGRSVTTAFNENYGGQRVDGIVGVNLLVPDGILKNNRIAVDLRFPLWQDLNGLQLETDWVLTAGWQLAF